MKMSTHRGPFNSLFMLSNIFLLLFISLSLSPICVAHSFLTRPKPYSRQFCRSCTSCPRELKNVFELDHISTTPSEVWSRDEAIDLRWAKNNHDGGFLRISLVPAQWRFNSSAHKRLAFYYGCWEQGMYTCHGARDCGADKSNRAFRRIVKVPDVVPDGVYTLAYMWYGGIHFKRRRGRFSDYTSCAYVRIQGGPLRKRFQPFFEAGDLGWFAHEENGLQMCATSATETEECSDGCDSTKMLYAVPKPFRNGRKPNIITPEHYYNHKTRGNDDEEQVVVQPPHNNMDTKEEEQKGDQRLCNYNAGVCCDRKCGSCQQKRCTERPGGRWHCCPWYIRNRSRRECASDVGAPCYLPDSEKRRQQA